MNIDRRDGAPPTARVSSSRKRYWLLVTLILISVKLAIFVAPHRMNVKFDGLSGAFWSFVHGPQTRYSEGYSDEAFLSARIGMTEREVTDLLGEPLGRIPFSANDGPRGSGRYTVILFSDANGGHGHTRDLWMQDGRVVAIKTGYNW